MGKKPTQQLDSSNSMSFSCDDKYMREALGPFLTAVENGQLSSQEFHFELITRNENLKVGRLNPQGTQNENLRKTLDKVLMAVDNGQITTEEFRLEIDTDLFQIELGSYLVVLDDDYADSSDSGEQIERPRLTTCVFITYFSFICHKASPLIIEALALIIILDKLRESSRNLKNFGRLLFPLMLLSQQTSGSIAYDMGDPVTLKQGDTGTIWFNDTLKTTDQSCDYVYVTVSIEGLNHPFYVDGSIKPEGLVTPNQGERFSVIPMREGCSLEIEFIITTVRIEDEGMYVVEIISYGTSLNSFFMKRQIMVYIPPGPATCFFTNSEYSHIWYEIHCHTIPGNGNTSLTCFQDGEKIPYIGQEAVVDRRIFWLMENKPVSCCSHDLKESTNITEKSCGQFKWPTITKKTTSEAPPTLVTIPITERSNIEYMIYETTRSGGTYASSKFLPSVILVVLALMGCIPGY